MSTPLAAKQEMWRAFLIDIELAKNHRRVNTITGMVLPAPNPILERLLPSLLYVRLGALLDEMFVDYIADQGLILARPYKDDFNGRITFLGDRGLLRNGSAIHSLRRKRNQLAHEAGQRCTWAELDEAIVAADVELQHLALVEPRPTYEFYAERTPRKEPEPGYLHTFDYCYGLKLGDQKAIEINWSEHLPFADE